MRSAKGTERRRNPLEISFYELSNTIEDCLDTLGWILSLMNHFGANSKRSLSITEMQSRDEFDQILSRGPLYD